MRKKYNLTGIKNDFGKNELFQTARVHINFMVNGNMGYLSVGDLESGVQYTVPADELINDLRNYFRRDIDNMIESYIRREK
ncbi:MAG: hypothetical protein IKH82_03815 [Clostridiales bacterium]|nr:hypothetical protein [Clostridiales bacterium]